MTAVRIGLVGAGFMGKIHSIAYRNAGMLFGSEIPSVETAAVTDFDPSLAERAARDWGWGSAVPSWQEITASDDIDVVDICTPNDNHVDIALDAIAARQACAVREAAGARRRQLLPVVRGGA